jgi:hypothetical protein
MRVAQLVLAEEARIERQLVGKDLLELRKGKTNGLVGQLDWWLGQTGGFRGHRVSLIDRAEGEARQATLPYSRRRACTASDVSDDLGVCKSGGVREEGARWSASG